MGDAPLDMGQWKAVFDWSMRFQDGTRPTDYSSVEEMPAEKREWLEAAMRECMRDIGARLSDIVKTLGSGSAAAAGAGAGAGVGFAGGAGGGGGLRGLAEEEALLDELAEIVESLDYARDLSRVGGLDTLLALLRCPYPSLRWRAAEVAATCMAGNPPVQRWFMAGVALGPLMELAADPEPRCATKALLALGALVRHYDPGLDAFRAAGGLARLLELLCPEVAPGGGSGSGGGGAGGGEDEEATAEEAAAVRRLRRKALALLSYVCAKHPRDAAAAAEQGGGEAVAAILGDPGADADARAAALEALCQMASTPGGWRALSRQAPPLAPRLRDLAAARAALSAADRDAAREEGDALARLTGLLAGPAPPEGGGQGGALPPLEDHVDPDPWQEGAAATKTLSVNGGGGGGLDAGGAAGRAAVGPAPAEQRPAPVLALPAPKP